VVYGPPVVRGGLGIKSIVKLVLDTTLMKNTLIHACAETAFVGVDLRQKVVLSITPCPSIIIL
jgi:hypothetical protein